MSSSVNVLIGHNSIRLVYSLERVVIQVSLLLLQIRRSCVLYCYYILHCVLLLTFSLESVIKILFIYLYNEKMPFSVAKFKAISAVFII